MTTYLVRCIGADGKAVTYSIRARSESRACREALRGLPKDYNVAWVIQPYS